MLRLTFRARALATVLLLAPLSACGSDNPIAGESDAAAAASAVDVDPASVTAEALRAAAGEDRLRRFYEAGQWQAVWDKEKAAALLGAIEEAHTHGLSRPMFVKQSGSSPAEREAMLTLAALDYASALANGVVDPSKLREIYTVPRPKVDVAAGLRQAIARNNVAEWLASLPPRTAEYQALSKAYVEHRRRSESESETAIQAGEAIKPGQSDPRVPRLVEALRGNGYLPPARPAEGQQAAQPSLTYTPEIAAAVKRMQQDYGIDADGIVGEDTLQILNTGAADRARQLAVNLERLRWLDRDPPPTRIDVNTGATFLTYWRDGRAVDRRRVVAGQPGWETPQLGSPIYQLVANPTWTVPRSIQEDELSDVGPGYLARNNMVWKDGWIVQQPGPKNSLGLVKLDMKNDHAIYLHDTPAKALFAENERHRSHGCVRVQNAVQFAHMIAEHDGVLPEFRRAMATGDETFVDLNREIPVRLMYHTAYFDGSRVQFRADAYGWDEDVARALGLKERERRSLSAHRRGSDFGP